jgi:hypothetical protein
MNFPGSPNNGQEHIEHGITYVYSSATNTWTKKAIVLSATNVPSSASGSLTSTNVQSALQELQGDIDEINTLNEDLELQEFLDFYIN